MPISPDEDMTLYGKTAANKYRIVRTADTGAVIHVPPDAASQSATKRLSTVEEIEIVESRSKARRGVV